MTITTRIAWDGGLGIATDSSGGDFDPVIASPPAGAPAGAFVSAFVVDDVTTTGAISVPSVRSATTTREDYRIVVGGKDATWIDGVKTPMPTFGLVSPLLYGSGQITFPQFHAALERFGHGRWTFLKKHVRVKVQRLNAAREVVATDYLGFIADDPAQARGKSLTLGGQATGRAAMNERPLPIFPVARDIGTLVMGTIQRQLRLPIANSPVTGTSMMETGGAKQLDFLTNALAMSVERDGTQWTVMPNSAGAYRMFQKDTATITATVYIDGFRVVEDLRRDFSEETNRVWIEGVDPAGRRQRFAKVPGMVTTHRAFPGSTLHPGDSGDDVTAIIWRLFSLGPLESAFGVVWTTASDDAVTEAIKDVQDDADLEQTGDVNKATWQAIFAGDAESLRRAAFRPAARYAYTQAFLEDATGNVIGHNPLYDRTKLLVDRKVSDNLVGFTRRQLKRFAKRKLADDATPNWVGTITVNTGAVVDGEHNPGDSLSASDVRDARSVKPGANLWLPNWDGGTLVHVSGVQVDQESVQFTVDTRARDTMEVWQIIQARRESRRSPDRQWDITNRKSGTLDDSGAFYDGGPFGKIERTFCAANEWTTVLTAAGRSGMLQKIDITTEDEHAEFAVEVWAKDRDTSWLNRKMGNPFDDGFRDHLDDHMDDWQDNLYLIDHWGWKDQPCGYGGARKTKDSGDTRTPTGRFVFRAGAPYFCKGKPMLCIAVYPDRDCWVQGGRVLELLLDDAAG